LAAIAVFLVLLMVGHSGRAWADPRPNLVVIMADDLSSDVVNTLLAGGWLPNLAGLANQGVTFQNSFVTTPLCGPSRATFLTGLYAHNHGVYSNISPNPRIPAIGWPGWLPAPGYVSQSERTLATWLQTAGYYTGHVGKFVNGYGAVAPAGVSDPKTYVPPGWNDWQGLIDPSTYSVYNYQLNDNGALLTYGSAESDYQTDVLAARAVAFVQEASALGGPFFLNIATLAPHIEVTDPAELLIGNDPSEAFLLDIRPAPRHAHLSDGNPANGELPGLPTSPSFNEADVSDKPSCPAPTPPVGIVMNYVPFCLREHASLRSDPDVVALEHQWKTMLASMLAVDDLVGDVIDALAVAGKLDNTVILFTSDNGWFYGEHRLTGKELAYEESIRVPLLIRAPGYAAGATASQAVLNTDLAPTLAAFAGATPAGNVDGASLLPILGTPGRTDWFRKSFLVEHWFIPSYFKYANPTYFALRSTGSPAYVYIGTQANQSNRASVTHREFYGLASDPDETASFALAPATSAVFDNFIKALRTCGGSTCRTLESY
jgi:arylsulfatase A-like enzyme